MVGQWSEGQTDAANTSATINFTASSWQPIPFEKSRLNCRHQSG
jgi:hypothetical protein